MGLTLLSQPAQAAIITVNSTQYDVQTFTGSYYPNSSKFATAANGGLMPWFANPTLADQFAQALYNLTPTNGGLNNNATSGYGPLFASLVLEIPTGPLVWSSFTSMNQGLTGVSVGQLGSTYVDGLQGFTYATATEVTTPTTPTTAVPEPLTMLGAATAVGFGALFKRRVTKATKK